MAPHKPRLYRSDDLLEVLADELPVREEGLLEVLRLLARRRVLLDPRASLRRPILPDDRPLVNEKQGEELGETANDWRADFADVRRRMEDVSRRIDEAAAAAASEVRPAKREAEPSRRGDESREELPELYWKARRFLVNPLERIASIICETYAEAGEDAVFSDDEALVMIRDLLLEVDATLIERTRGTNLAAKDRRWQLFAERAMAPAAGRPVPEEMREVEL